MVVMAIQGRGVCPEIGAIGANAQRGLPIGGLGQGREDGLALRDRTGGGGLRGDGAAIPAAGVGAKLLLGWFLGGASRAGVGRGDGGEPGVGFGQERRLKLMISIEAYLRSSYDPDCDFLEGHLMERNVGELDHSDVQTAFAVHLRTRYKAYWCGVEAMSLGTRRQT